MTWPTAELDRISRLRVLAAGLPGAVLQEYRVETPFESVWRYMSDLEHSVPDFDEDVSRLRIVQQNGSSLTLRANAPWWMARLPLRFDVDLTEGWCWMVARPQLYVVGMVAEPDGDGTRMAHLEGIPLPSPKWMRGFLRPLLAASRWRHRRHVRSDVAGIKRALSTL